MLSADFRVSGGQADLARRQSCASGTKFDFCTVLRCLNVEGDGEWSQQPGCISSYPPSQSAEDFLANYLSNEELCQATGSTDSVNPHTSKKMAMDRARTEKKSRQHLKDCADMGTWRLTERNAEENRREREKQAWMTFMGCCCRIGVGPSWMAQSFGWSKESSWARRGQESK